MREIRPSGSEGGGAIRSPYPYRGRRLSALCRSAISAIALLGVLRLLHCQRLNVPFTS